MKNNKNAFDFQIQKEMSIIKKIKQFLLPDFVEQIHE